MHRFFIPPENIQGDVAILPENASRQLFRVLRARVGDQILVLDNSGWEYTVTLNELSANHAQGKIVAMSESQGEPSLCITLYQGTLKADKFELVLQKGTELGISRFVPVHCSRSVPKERVSPNRQERWRRIITEATEQSGRGKIPLLDDTLDFRGACDIAEGLALIPWEQEKSFGLKSAMEGCKDMASISIFVGPEGGFAEDEIAYAQGRGITPVSLGRRILRAETAGIVVASAILYHLGELGG